jgi:predicted DNA-binding transcriptional regulator YafY
VKGEGRKFRINNDNFQLLQELEDIEHYGGSLGLYLKAVFESYAKLPFYQRERIYFKQTVDIIEQAIHQQKELVVELSNSHRFRVSPYRIQPDKLFTYQYLVGYGERISKYEATRNYMTFRLSRIKRVRMNISRSGRIRREESSQLEQLLMQNGPQFLSVQPAQIVVSFTKAGVHKYQNQLFMRPPITEQVDETTYRFDCSETQAYYYFFKFGKDAEVLEPTTLRNRFLHEYSSAMNTYNTQSK